MLFNRWCYGNSRLDNEYYDAKVKEIIIMKGL